MNRVCVGIAGEPCTRITATPRCPECARKHEATRTRRSKGHYDSEWQRIRAQAIREHPWCGVCGTPGTPDNPLTGDHLVPWSHGGRNVRSNVQVLCRRHNSSRGNRAEVE
jgi:5-methylcytosine-specific restriction protein A